MEGKIQFIGKEAWEKESSMLILFGETVTPALKNYSVVQSFDQKEVKPLFLGQEISFGTQQYRVEKIGRLANNNLKTLGHVTLVFGPTPTHDELVNAVYLSPYVLPEVEVGMKIHY